MKQFSASLYGMVGNSPSRKSALTLEGFWSLIERSQFGSNEDPCSVVDLLWVRLISFRPETIMAFGTYLEGIHFQLCNSEIRETLLKEGRSLSADEFESFCAKAILQGREFCERVIANPYSALQFHESMAAHTLNGNFFFSIPERARGHLQRKQLREALPQSKIKRFAKAHTLTASDA